MIKTTRVITFFFLLVSIACGTVESQDSIPDEVTFLKFDDFKIGDYPFDVKLEMEEINEEEYFITTTIVLLKKGSYIVSPFSKDSTYMHFALLIEDQEHFTINDDLLEIPSSVEEFDPILDMQVRFVRVPTVYKQKIKITNQADFEMSGLVEFLVEPACVPYHVEFSISQIDGKIIIEKTKTSFHPSYKGGGNNNN